MVQRQFTARRTFILTYFSGSEHMANKGVGEIHNKFLLMKYSIAVLNPAFVIYLSFKMILSMMIFCLNFKIILVIEHAHQHILTPTHTQPLTHAHLLKYYG